MGTDKLSAVPSQWISAVTRRHPAPIICLTPICSLSPAEDHVDSVDDRSDVAWRKCANSFRQLRPVKSNDQRHVGDRILGQAGRRRFEQDIAGCVGPPEVACQGNADDSSDTASIHGIALHHDDRPSETGRRSCWRVEISPPDVSLSDYHSTCRNVRRAALLLNSSTFVPTSSKTWFMAAVILSSSC